MIGEFHPHAGWPYSPVSVVVATGPPSCIHCNYGISPITGLCYCHGAVKARHDAAIWEARRVLERNGFTVIAPAGEIP